jgi:citrate lyase alpha subunit
MKPKKDTQQTEPKKDRRGPGQTQTTISISEEALKKARDAAKAEDRSLSNFLERLIMSSGKIGGLLASVIHSLGGGPP